MRSRAPYTPAKLYIDGVPDLEVGNFLVSNGGSVYLVQAMRPSPTIRQRRYLDCVRWPAAEVPDDATVYEFYWYRRPRKRRA